MITRILKLTVAAFLMSIGIGALAAEPKCTASACAQPDWPEATAVAPAMTMDTDVPGRQVAEAVEQHLAMDESPVGHAEAIHKHFDSHVSGKVAADSVEEHLASDETPAGHEETVHAHGELVASAR
jgi:hypothetical protein